MELALPHVFVRICRPGIGPEVVSALSLHPVEVSEARDLPEAIRVSGGRPPVLAVVVEPRVPDAVVNEVAGRFPGVPMLLVSDGPPPVVSGGTARIDVVSGRLPLETICWHVMEAVSRAGRAPGLDEHPLGPVIVEVDAAAIVTAETDGGHGLLIDGHHVRAGDSLLAIVDPFDRDMFADALRRTQPDEVRFFTARLVSERGDRHAVSVGVRHADEGGLSLLIQPLIFGGPIVGRHLSNRDPITGLLTRWAMSRALESREHRPGTAEAASVLLLRVEDFAAISNCVGSAQTDCLLVRMASVINLHFPYPAQSSRLMGDSFLVYLPGADAGGTVPAATHLIQAVNRIEVPGFSAGFTFRTSVGIAAVTEGDHDLAIRLAEAAAGEAQAAGGNRAVVAGAGQFTSRLADELSSSMDLGAWEVWLQPVMRNGSEQVEFHESLARFGSGRPRMASRADFFMAGRAEGLLERFDEMMLMRCLELLASHPHVRLSVNLSYETFVSDAFPAGVLALIRGTPAATGRIVLEIAPRCMAAPAAVVRSRLESLAAAGVAVALDDFGSGICRLRYLTQYPLAIVKLDEVVTGYVDDDPLQREFVRTVVSLCRARGILTVAEYTRSPEQLWRLVEDGVDLFQGELFGMPRPAAEVLRPPGGEVDREARTAQGTAAEPLAGA